MALPAYDFLVQEQQNPDNGDYGFAAQGWESALPWPNICCGNEGKPERPCLFSEKRHSNDNETFALDVLPSPSVEAETWTGQTGAQM